MIRINFLYLFFLVIFSNFSLAQNLHHQMISCMGGNKIDNLGVRVFFTVGQQSVIGGSSRSFTVQQGFQQSKWSKIIQQNSDDITITAYPNPFKDIVNFSFSKYPIKNIDIKVFDFLGRIVYFGSFESAFDIISLNLNTLPSAQYIARLTSNNFIFSTIIIKQ